MQQKIRLQVFHDIVKASRRNFMAFRVVSYRALIALALATIMSLIAFPSPTAFADQSPPETLAQIPPPSYSDASVSADWVAVPGGLAYHSCIYEVPNGSEVSESGIVTLNGKVIKNIPACPYSGIVPALNSTPSNQNRSNLDLDASEPPATRGFVGGWWLSTWWTASADLTKVSIKWKVPANPTNSGATLFLYASIKPTKAASGLLQPVLQWGAGNGNGSNSWAIASWYVASPGGNSVHSPLLATASGHNLSGSILRANNTTSGWSVEITDTTTGKGTGSLFNTGITSWRSVQGAVLEIGKNDKGEALIKACNQLPNVTQFEMDQIIPTTTSGAVPPFFAPDSGHPSVSSCNARIGTGISPPPFFWDPKASS